MPCVSLGELDVEGEVRSKQHFRPQLTGAAITAPVTVAAPLIARLDDAEEAAD